MPSMYYWNKPNFEGLLEAAAELELREETRGLADYCRHRQEGLRGLAFQALRTWLDSTELWSNELKRSVCLSVLELDARLPQVHQFLSHPLREQFALPILREWYEDDRSLPPTRWRGLLERDADLLRAALELDPLDVAVRRRLVDYALGDVEYQTHHLYEGVFLGEITDAEAALERADELLETAPIREPFDHLILDAAQLRQLIRDWLEYNASPSGTFPEWCRARGRAYSWSRTYYCQSPGAS